MTVSRYSCHTTRSATGSCTTAPVMPPATSAGRSTPSPKCAASARPLVTTEIASAVTSGLALAAHFGDGVLRPADVAGGITGAVVQDPVADRVVWQEYLETVIRDRDEWNDFYRACRDVDAPNG